MEKLTINNSTYYSEETEKNILEYLLSLKVIKEVNLELSNIRHLEISKLKKINLSLTKIEIDYIHERLCYLENLENLFPNLTDLFLNLKEKGNIGASNLEIKENANSKVTNLKIIFNEACNAKVFCQIFTYLTSIDLTINRLIKLNNVFPIFAENCKLKFNNLLKFHFSSNLCLIDQKILDNIYINIDYMPNLKDFYLKSYSKVTIHDMTVDKFYKAFIKKILSLKNIKRIEIFLDKYYAPVEEPRFYSREDIQLLFPNINLNNIFIIKIKK